MTQRGDVVILTLGGRDFNALVHQANTSDRSHLGKNGESTLHLSYVPDNPIDTNTGKPKALPLGQIPQSVVLYDVVHASHEFHEMYVQKHSIKTDAELVARRGMGEWQEATVIPTVDVGTDKELDDIADVENSAV